MSDGPRLQVEIAQTDDSTRNTQVILDPETGNIAVDYSQYYDRIATATEALQAAAEAQQAAVEEIRDIITGVTEPSGGGIPMKDVYAALSYSTLIDYFNTEGKDVNELMTQVKAILTQLESN
jgi:hypothetical protein